MRRFARFVAGREYFVAAQGFQTLFLNACRAAGVHMYELTVTADEVRGSVKWGEFSKVLQAAAASGMTVECVRKTGLRAIVQRYRARIGIPVGLLAAALVFQMLSGVLWNIELTGTRRINSADFMRFLSDAGVNTGTFLCEIDCDAIERTAQTYSPDVLLVTANLVGCKLYIHVTEREVPSEIKNSARYGNVVAAKDGEVLSADIFAGEANVRAGDAVLKGDLLASGVQTLSDGTVRLLEAQASIMARTVTRFSCQTALRVKARQITSVKDRYSVCFFGLHFPPGTQTTGVYSYLQTAAGTFPIGVLRCRETETNEAYLELSERQADLICRNDLALFALGALTENTLVQCRVHSSPGDPVSLDAQLICEEDIAQKQFFEVLNDRE